jgi:hypothetical protein
MLGNPIRPTSNVDLKSGLTLVITINANGDKLPLYYIAAGKTMKCTQKLNLSSYDLSSSTSSSSSSSSSSFTWSSSSSLAYHSESGWMRESVMKDYIKRIVHTYTQVDLLLLY